MKPRNYRAPYVRCPGCGWSTERIVRDDGGYGSCHKCGQLMQKAAVMADKRAEKAKRELAGGPWR